MYEILSHKRAVKYYEGLDDKTAWRVNKAIDEIRKDPCHGSHIKKLKGKLKGKYRYDTDSLRIVYIVDEEKKTIYIEAIGPRGDVYK